MNNRFSFHPHPGGKNSTEANIFIHGYSAGHNEESRQTLQASIPDSSHSCVNIFAFWSSGHFTQANDSSLQLLRASAKMHWAALPAAFVGDRATHFWKIRSRAEEMGKVFIAQLDDFLRNNHPKVETINLIGHSLGARVIVSTLRAVLDGASLRRYSINNVLLMGAAVEVDTFNARQLCDMVSGRIINAYSTTDRILILNAGETCAGRRPVEHFENVEMVGFGHVDYWPNLAEVMIKVRFNSLLKRGSAREKAIQLEPHSSLGVLFSDNNQQFELTGVEPCDIHGEVIKELSRFSETLRSTFVGIEVDALQAEALNTIFSTYARMCDELSGQCSIAEWDNLNVAVLGERNSGKSTLVDTLRILFSEPTKAADRKNFTEHLAQYNTKQKGRKIPSGNAIDLHNESENLEKNDSALLSGIKQLDEKVSSFLGASRDLLNVKKRDVIREVFSKFPAAQNDYNTRSTETVGKVLASTNEDVPTLKVLVEFADGAIISGGSRYAETTVNRYSVDRNEKTITIIDFPGIDSSGTGYIAEVALHLNSTHAIFYVIQSVEVDNDFLKDLFDLFDGQLGSHSEIWIIFNKKVTSPALFTSGAELITRAEKASLSWLDTKMKQKLGARFGGILDLSAGIALFACAEHFLPGSPLDIRKRKFSNRFTSNELAELSQIGMLVSRLEDSLISKADVRIVRANLSRVNYSISCGKAILETEQQRLKEIQSTVASDSEIARRQLDISFNSLMQRLEVSGELVIENLIRDARKTVYSLIDQGASNSVFKDCLISTLSTQKDRLGDVIFELMQVELERFQLDIKHIFNRLDSRTRDQINVYMHPEKSFYTGFKSPDQLEGELTAGNLAATVAGGMLAVIGTGGWSLAIGAAGIASTLTSTLWNHLDAERKQSQQRKVTGSHLSEVKSQWTDELRDHMGAHYPELRKRLELVSQAIIDHGKPLTVAIETLSTSANHLQSVSNKLSQLDYLK